MDLLLKSPKEGTLLGMQFHGTKLFQVFGLLMSQGRAQSSAGVQEELPLTIGATLVLAVVLFFVLVINRNEWKLKERLFGCIIELFIYGMIAVCITTCYYKVFDFGTSTFQIFEYCNCIFDFCTYICALYSK